ncbi:MAG: class I lanthipeptide [Hyphomicrobiales bacterium]
MKQRKLELKKETIVSFSEHDLQKIMGGYTQLKVCSDQPTFIQICKYTEFGDDCNISIVC